MENKLWGITNIGILAAATLVIYKVAKDLHTDYKIKKACGEAFNDIMNACKETNKI